MFRLEPFLDSTYLTLGTHSPIRVTRQAGAVFRIPVRNNPTTPFKNRSGLNLLDYRREKVASTSTGDGNKLSCVTSASQVITSGLGRKSRRSLDLIKLQHPCGSDDVGPSASASTTHNLWTSSFAPRVERPQRHITSALPLELTWFVMGFSKSFLFVFLFLCAYDLELG